MRVFVVNSGSSSIKYQLIDVDSAEVVLAGLLERLGEDGGDAADHEHGMRVVLDRLGDEAASIDAVGHRVVHGGSAFDCPPAPPTTRSSSGGGSVHGGRFFGATGAICL